ncbi:hypothetical protein GCM10009743_66320 [Kribbella swartbergensis]
MRLLGVCHLSLNDLNEHRETLPVSQAAGRRFDGTPGRPPRRRSRGADVNVVETARAEPELSTDFWGVAPAIVEKPGTAWGQVTQKLCTAGDTDVDNFTPVIPAHSRPEPGAPITG